MKRQRSRNTGFTLLESMVCVLLIMVVVGAVFSQMQKAQAGYRVEGQKVDLTQQDRQFIDQFTRDLRQAGYPGPQTLGLVPVDAIPLGDPRISAGITAISGNSVTMEGDLDNSGTVQIVTYTYNNANAFPCPCIQRTIVPKTGGVPAIYTEVQNVINPGGGPIFTPYDVNGGAQPGLTLTLPAGATTKDGTYGLLHQIKSIGVTFTTQARTNELNGRTPVQVTMTGMARIPND